MKGRLEITFIAMRLCEEAILHFGYKSKLKYRIASRSLAMTLVFCLSAYLFPVHTVEELVIVCINVFFG